MNCARPPGLSLLRVLAFSLFVLSCVWGQAAEKRPRVVDGNSNSADLRESVNAFFMEPIFDPTAANPCLGLAGKYLGAAKEKIETELRGLGAKYRYYVHVKSSVRSTTLSFFSRSKSKERLIEWQEDIIFSYDDADRLTQVERGAGARRIIQQRK